MRDFFINAFEKLVGLIVIVLSAGVLIGAIAALLGAGGSNAPNGLIGALIILVGGGVYILFVGGVMYLGLGIYQNTRRMADLLERGGPRL